MNLENLDNFKSKGRYFYFLVNNNLIEFFFYKLFFKIMGLKNNKGTIVM